MFENEETDAVPVSDKNNTERIKELDQIPPKAGIFHTNQPMGEVHYKRAEDESVMQNAGAYIVLGTDRPGSNRDGYGAMGAGKANSIDLVVGRMASAQKGQGPNTPAWVDNSYSADAARINISQLTNIDHNNASATTTVPQSIARSGITIKADGVRVIGREGIKIITGVMDGVDEPNSLGGRIRQPSPEIAFIAGNSTANRVQWGGLFNPRETIKGLQPLCLGYITRDAFLEMNETIQTLMSVVMAMALIQEMFNAILGIDQFRPWVTAASVTSNAAALSFVNSSLIHLKANAALYEWNYLSPSGPKFICSRNVKTT